MAWRRGDRVLVAGRPGCIVTMDRRPRVAFDAGGLGWPDLAIVESSGRHELRCGECAERFRSDDLRAPLCPNCERRLDPPQPAPPAKPINISPEVEAAEAERRRREEEENPF